jgi:hypothetical protein
MATSQATEHQHEGLARTVNVARLFIEALNARDRDALRALVTEDVAFPTPQGKALAGEHGLEAIIDASVDADLLLARIGSEAIEDRGGTAHVVMSVREFVQLSKVRGRAVFDVVGDRVASFEVLTDQNRHRLFP